MQPAATYDLVVEAEGVSVLIMRFWSLILGKRGEDKWSVPGRRSPSGVERKLGQNLFHDWQFWVNGTGLARFVGSGLFCWG